MNESIVKGATCVWFRELGYAAGQPPHLAPGEPGAGRKNYNRDNPYA
jgi:hypothetical protein